MSQWLGSQIIGRRGTVRAATRLGDRIGSAPRPVSYSGNSHVHRHRATYASDMTLRRIAAARRYVPRLSVRVGFLTSAAVLGVLAAGLLLIVLTRPYEAAVAAPAWTSIALFAAFMLLGEAVPLRLGLRNEMLRVTIATIPFVIGLLLLPPLPTLASYAAVALLAAVIHRSLWPVVVMNTALALFEAGLSLAILSLWAVPLRQGELLDSVQPRMLPVAVTMVALTVISAFAVTLIHRLIGVAESVPRALGQSVVVVLVMTGITFVAFTVWLAVPAGPVLSLSLLAVAIVLYRNYSAFRRQHDSLADLYEFGGRVLDAGGDLETWQGLVNGIRQQLHARTAVLYLIDRPGGELVLAADHAGPRPAAMRPSGDEVWAAAQGEGFAIVSPGRTVDPAVRAALADRGASEVIVVAMRARERVRGYLEVWDPRSRWAHFTDDDRRLLQTLVGHLATAVDNQRLVSRLQHEAYHDSVTGLANRLGLDQRAQAMIGAGEYGGVLLIDLGVLGEVTSALGHDRGEQMLVTAGNRLAESAGPDRLVGRLDGDRFAVLLEPQSAECAHDLARALLRVATQPMILVDVEVEYSGVAGLALAASTAPGAASHPVLLQQAQLALQSARAGERDLVAYHPAIGEIYQRRFQLVSQFRGAVDTGRILLHYQPKVTLQERELIGVEALVRWMHPEYGFVPPTELIDAIENTTAIDVLFAHVLDRALAQSVTWQRAGRRIPVAVNLSVRNLLAAGLTDTVAAALQRNQVPAEMLTLEITESSVMAQPERSLPVLTDLHNLGIRLSVDDFGTGYSSLAYLRRLPVDELKIDKSFVQGMVTDLGDLAIVRAIIDLGHSLGLRVVAEGVEEEAGRDALRSMHCDAMQGFLLARPLPIERFESWVSSRTGPLGEDVAADRLRMC